MDPKWIWCESLNWKKMSQVKVQWRHFVNKAMKLWISWRTDNFLTRSAIIKFSKIDTLGLMTECRSRSQIKTQCCEVSRHGVANAHKLLWRTKPCGVTPRNVAVVQLTQHQRSNESRFRILGWGLYTRFSSGN